MKLDWSKEYILKFLLILFLVLAINGASDEKYALNGGIGNYAKGDGIGIYLMQSNNNNLSENSVTGNIAGIVHAQ
jgi:parallel beta-helix repeat protein